MKDGVQLDAYDYKVQEALYKNRALLKNRILCSALLAKVQLPMADLSGSDIAYADFRRADLSYADVRARNYTRTNFRGADLSHARLCVRPSLFKAVFDTETYFRKTSLYNRDGMLLAAEVAWTKENGLVLRPLSKWQEMKFRFTALSQNVPLLPFASAEILFNQIKDRARFEDARQEWIHEKDSRGIGGQATAGMTAKVHCLRPPSC